MIYLIELARASGGQDRDKSDRAESRVPLSGNVLSRPTPSIPFSPGFLLVLSRTTTSSSPIIPPLFGYLLYDPSKDPATKLSPASPASSPAPSVSSSMTHPDAHDVKLKAHELKDKLVEGAKEFKEEEVKSAGGTKAFIAGGVGGICTVLVGMSFSPSSFPPWPSSAHELS